MSENKYTTKKNKKASNLQASDTFMIFAGIIFAASAAFTFAFFYTFLPGIFPPDVLSESIAPWVSGGLGVAIFDGGALAWLIVYLKGCDNEDQRNIAMSTSMIDIVGSALATLTQLLLGGQALVALEQTTRDGIGWGALIFISICLTFNFVSVWRFHKNSDESKLAQREADRLAVLRNAEDESMDHYDQLLAQEIKDNLAAIAPEEAKKKAQELVRQRRDFERANTAGTRLPTDGIENASLEDRIADLLTEKLAGLGLGTGGGGDQQIDDHQGTDPKN